MSIKFNPEIAGGVNLETVSFLFNCMAYRSTQPVTVSERPVPRLVKIRVSDGVNREDGRSTVSIDFLTPFVQTPGMRADIGVTPQLVGQVHYLLPKGGIALHDRTVLSAGFVEARMVGTVDTRDSVFLHYQRRSQYTMKDGILYCCNECVGRYLVFGKTWVRVEFTAASKNVDKKRITEMLRLLAYTTTEDHGFIQKCVEPTAAQREVSDLARYEDAAAAAGPDSKLIIVRGSDGETGEQKGRPLVNTVEVYVQPERPVDKGKKRMKAAAAVVKMMK